MLDWLFNGISPNEKSQPSFALNDLARQHRLQCSLTFREARVLDLSWRSERAAPFSVLRSWRAIQHQSVWLFFITSPSSFFWQLSDVHEPEELRHLAHG